MNIGKRSIIAATGVVCLCGALFVSFLAFKGDNALPENSSPVLSQSAALFDEAAQIGARVEAMVKEAKNHEQEIAEKIDKQNLLKDDIRSLQKNLQSIEEKHAEAMNEKENVAFDSNLDRDQWAAINHEIHQKLARLQKDKNEKAELLNSTVEKSKTLQTEIDALEAKIDNLDLSIKKGFIEWEQAENAAKAALNNTETAGGSP